jgi:hypothetical protein
MTQTSECEEETSPKPLQSLKAVMSIIVDMAVEKKKEIAVDIDYPSENWLLSVYQPGTEISWSLSPSGHFLIADERAINKDNANRGEDEEEDKTHYFKHEDGHSSITCSFPYNMEGMTKAFNNMHSNIIETVNDWDELTIC